MGQRCVSAMLDRVREITRMEQQAEKLTALGKLAANLSHELKQPGHRPRSVRLPRFLPELRDYGDKKYLLGASCHSTETCEQLHSWATRTRTEMAEYLAKNPRAACWTARHRRPRSEDSGLAAAARRARRPGVSLRR